MGEWLTKDEVNSLYYNTVAGEIAFITEASKGRHAEALARLVALKLRAAGKRHLRILEIAANDCAFQRELLGELRMLIESGVAELDRIDYVAVEYARGPLETAAAWEEEHGTHDRVLRPPGAAAGSPDPAKPSLVALLTDEGPPAVNVGLVHAEATRFVRENEKSFDVAILNELFDDMPYRAYYADEQGHCREAVAYSRPDDSGWTVRIASEEVEDDTLALPPGTLTARSPESVEVVRGIASRLVSGGMLFVHDYGFAESPAPLVDWEPIQSSVPPFVTFDFPEGSEHGFPRGFYRVFGNDRHRLVQVTNDVNFAELAAALEETGTVTILAHGNAIITRGGTFEKGDGVFLAEFLLLEPGDDLPALLADLHARQKELREAYMREHVSGHANVFLDLLYVKA